MAFTPFTPLSVAPGRGWREAPLSGKIIDSSGRNEKTDKEDHVAKLVFCVILYVNELFTVEPLIRPTFGHDVNVKQLFDDVM